jgi:hypothetical protein
MANVQANGKSAPQLKAEAKVATTVSPAPVTSNTGRAIVGK